MKRYKNAKSDRKKMQVWMMPKTNGRGGQKKSKLT